MDNYLQKRAERDAKERLVNDKAFIARRRRELKKVYAKLISKVESQEADYFSEVESLLGKELSKQDKEAILRDVDSFNRQYPDFKIENPPFSQLSRGTALIKETELLLSRYGVGYLKEFKTHQIQTINTAYLKGVFNAETAKGLTTTVGVTYTGISPRRVDALLSSEWFSGNYESRVIKNNKQWIKEISESLMEWTTEGSSIDDLISDLMKSTDMQRTHIATLVQSETAFIAENATLAGYKDRGINSYRYLATLEVHTCEVCGRLDGQSFPVSEAQFQVNYPPIHANCRCTTVPEIVVDGKVVNRPVTRWFRDPETGKGGQAPYMSFETWKKKYVVN